MIEDAELVENVELINDETIIINGKNESGSEECEIRLSKDNITWEYKPYMNVYKRNNKRFRYSLPEITLNLVRGQRGIMLTSKTYLTIVKKNNTEDRRDWNMWSLVFENKQNTEVEEFLELFNIRKEKIVKLAYYERNKKIAQGFEKRENYDAAIKIWKELDNDDEIIRILNIQSEKLIREGKYAQARNLWKKVDNKKELELFTIKIMKLKANEREKAKDYESAIEIWEALGEIEEAARVRKLQAELGSVKLSQKVVHGDEVTKTEIKDSVLNKSNVGSGGSSKMQELRELKEMFDSGFISKEEMEDMKKEILGK